MIDKIYTIGYEKTLIGDFIATVKAAGIEKIIDVRQLPISRRKGFSKNIFRGFLAEAGIDYVHLKGLGTPKEGRIASKNGDHKRFVEIFENQMKSAEAEADLKIAIELGKKEVCCLLCYERHQVECHRDIVVKAIVAQTEQEVVPIDILEDSKQAFLL